MNRNSSVPARQMLLCAVLALAAVLPCGLSVADDATAARVIELYDAANYAEARRLLEQMDAAGEMSGALIYRLFYCQRATGYAALSTETLHRAVKQLEQEMNDGADLEAGFYLATGYENLGRKDKALEVVTATLGRVEAGEIDATTGVDRFRLGKLYADQTNEIEAANWYRSAIQAFRKEGSGNTAYIAWASRYLADQALAMEDYSAAEIHLTDLVENSAPTVEDLDRLAIARVRNGMFRDASEAWKQALPLSAAQANRSRYCARLATMAAPMDSLLETAPSGKAWDDLTREEFEMVLKDQAAVVREIKVEAAETEELSEIRRKEMTRTLKATKQVFVSAGLEFALHGYDIREAAFLGGYAPLVFQTTEWRLARVGEKPKRSGKRRENHEQLFQGVDEQEE